MEFLSETGWNLLMLACCLDDELALDEILAQTSGKELKKLLDAKSGEGGGAREGRYGGGEGDRG